MRTKSGDAYKGCVLLNLGERVSTPLTCAFVKGSILGAFLSGRSFPFRDSIHIRLRDSELLCRLVIWMESDEAVLANDTLEQHEVAEHFVAIVDALQQMLSETCTSSRVTQGHVIFWNDMDVSRQ